uniref:Uncharacterized protein n=1 Tax=Anguilla anguilla TaxID=7936 RepID=A0A0E9X4U9_ANGAN
MTILFICMKNFPGLEYTTSLHSTRLLKMQISFNNFNQLHGDRNVQLKAHHSDGSNRVLEMKSINVQLHSNCKLTCTVKVLHVEALPSPHIGPPFTKHAYNHI